MRALLRARRTNLMILAFHHPSTNRLTIVGRNTGSGNLTIAGLLANLPAPAAIPPTAPIDLAVTPLSPSLGRGYSGASLLGGTDGMTLEAWVYPTTLSGGSTNGWRTVILKQQSTQLAYALYANSNTNRPNSYVYTSSDQGIFGNTQLPLNTWRHLAITYDGAALRLYVSGTLVGICCLPGSITTSGQPLRISGNSV